MTHQHHQIGAAAAQLADRLPHPLMVGVAEAVTRCGSLDRPAARQAILGCVPTPAFREATAEFIDLWHATAAGVGAEAVAVALVTALKALGGDVASACSVYYWPQEQRAKDENGKVGILHVKCAVADGYRMFLSSANLTEYAFTINMELGLLVTGGKLPEQVERHFERLVAAGTLLGV
jgi:hypothetical protein